MFLIFISQEEEVALLDCITKTDFSRWKEMKSGRSLKMYGGTVTPNGLEHAEELPSYFELICDRLHS